MNNLREILRYFNQNLLQNSTVSTTWETKTNKDQGDSAAAEEVSGDSITSPRDACQTNSDLSWEREERDAALAKQVVEPVAREMAKAHTHYQALLNERDATAMPTSLMMTSRALGFKVMDPFD